MVEVLFVPSNLDRQRGRLYRCVNGQGYMLLHVKAVRLDVDVMSGTPKGSQKVPGEKKIVFAYSRLRCCSMSLDKVTVQWLHE